MEPLVMKDKRKSQRIPVELTVQGELEDRRIAMCSENISLEGMFLFCREIVRPRAVIPAKVWLSNEREPLQIYLTSCFTERTWTGYGIGVCISGISGDDRAQWEEYYRSCAAGRSERPGAAVGGGEVGGALVGPTEAEAEAGPLQGVAAAGDHEVLPVRLIGRSANHAKIRAAAPAFADARRLRTQKDQ